MPSDKLTALQWDIIKLLVPLEGSLTSIATSLAQIATAIAAPPESSMGSIKTCANLIHEDFHDVRQGE